MDEEFDESGGASGTWNIGDTLSDLVSGYFGLATAKVKAGGIQWTTNANGTATGIGSDGSVYTRGVPGSVTTTSSITTVVLIALIGFGAYFALKK